MKTTVDRFGRVVVPKSMRERLGLRAGSAIEIEEIEGRISLRPAETSSPLTMKEGILVFEGMATGDLEAATGADRERRAHRLAGPISR